MHAYRVRPLVVEAMSAEQRCAACAVRQTSVCDVIDEGALGRLAAAAEHVDLPRHRVFIDEGTPAAAFFNITLGTVKLFKLLPDGRQQITGFAGPGYFLGLAGAGSYAFSAETIEPVRACRFSRPRLVGLRTAFPALEARLLQTACNELAAAQDQMLLLGRKTARERLASFLLRLSEEQMPCGGVHHALRLAMTRGEIADYLGLTIETVSRTFSRFRAGRKLITPNNETVIVLDKPWLTRLAHGEMETV